MASPLRSLVQPGDIACAFGLLTRLPIHSQSTRGAEAAWAWPIVGLALGAAAGAIASVALWFGLPSGGVAALALALLAFATGAMHEDGLSDTADGLFGGNSREQRLEIMKDSRIGSFGSLALILVTLARWSALVSLCLSGHLLVALAASAALSRAPMALVMAFLPAARPSGLSAAVGRPSVETALLGLALASAAALFLTGFTALVALGLALISCFIIASLAENRIGGQTGDIIGACQQVSDALILLVLAAALGVAI